MSPSVVYILTIEAAIIFIVAYAQAHNSVTKQIIHVQ